MPAPDSSVLLKTAAPQPDWPMPEGLDMADRSYINAIERNAVSDNKLVLKTANEAISAGDIEGFLSFCDDDIRWKIMGGDAIQGKESVRQWMKSEYVEPPRFCVTDLVAEGDLVVAIGQIESRDSAGSPTLSSYSDVWCFRNGKMVDLRAYVVGAVD